MRIMILVKAPLTEEKLRMARGSARAQAAREELELTGAVDSSGASGHRIALWFHAREACGPRRCVPSACTLPSKCVLEGAFDEVD